MEVRAATMIAGVKKSSAAEREEKCLFDPLINSPALQR